MRATFLFAIVFFSFLLGCDKGLAPVDRSGKAVLFGEIHLASPLPTKDSNTILAVALIRSAAPYTDSSLIQGIGNGNVLPIILDYPFRDTTYSYTLDPGTYGYLGVAFRYGPDVVKDWEVVSAASDGGSVQGISLRSGVSRQLNLRINFDSLPAQPFIR